MAVLSTPQLVYFVDANGDPITEGDLYTYEAGTTTPLPTYTDQSKNGTNPNPFALTGPPGQNIWWEGAYKVDVKDSNGVSLPGYPVDNLAFYDVLDWSGLTASIADLNATDTSTVSVSSVTTITLSQRGKTILCNAGSGGFTVNLLAATTDANGYEITIKKTDVSTNLVTIDGNGGETIEGRTTFILYDQNDVVTLLCDGSNWRIKSGVIRGNTELKSAAFSVTIADINKTFLCSATAAYAITLLSAATAGDGFKVTFKKLVDEEILTITPAGMETIDGQSTFILTADYQAVSIISNGTDWYIYSENISSAYQTGDIKQSIISTTPPGWLPLDDGTIGDGTSGANYANTNTRSLFITIWDDISAAYCPIYTSAGVITTRGATALDDFNAHKRLKLPRGPGHVLGIAGGPGSQSFEFTADESTDLLTVPNVEFLHTGDEVAFATTNALPSPLMTSTPYYVIQISSTTIKVASSLNNAHAGTAIDITTNGTGIQTIFSTLTTRTNGQYVGQEKEVLLTSEMPSHVHSITGIAELGSGGAGANIPDGAGNTGATGGNQPHTIMQPTVFFWTFIKL